MTYVKEVTVLQQCDCGPARVWEGGVFVLQDGTEQKAWCECALIYTLHQTQRCVSKPFGNWQGAELVLVGVV